jgi:enamine deaminase RidA (YjgF/YER057c/UK114 family)
MTIERLNPPTLHKNPAYAQGMLVRGPARIVYVGGQNGVDAQGKVVGDDLRSQTAQALKNVEAVLAAGGATIADIVRMGINVVAGQDLGAGFAAFQETWGSRARPTAITVLLVAGLGVPGALVEIDAIAAVEDGRG